MTNIGLKSLILFLTLAIGFFLGTRCTQDKGGAISSKPNIKTEYVYIHDTIPREITKVVTVDKPTLKTVYKDRIIPVIQPDSTPTLAVRDYNDTIQIQPNIKGFYNATTTGTLDHITLGFKDTRPEIRTTLQITNTVTTKVPVTGLYVGGFSSPNLSAYGVEAQIVMPRVSFGAGYNFRSPEIQPLNKVQVHLGYNLFPVKN